MLDCFNLHQSLQKQQTTNRYRQLTTIETGVTPTITINGKDYINFASNDYLGLASDPCLIDCFKNGVDEIGQIGSGASHLITGHSIWHERLAETLAHVTGYEKALTFSTGYMANVGVIQALATKDTVIFSDKLNHASIIDGIMLSRAKLVRFNHRDYDFLQHQLSQTTAKQKLIITDHVFSMDGTMADLSVLQTLAERYQCGLMVDDAHGFGLPYQAYKGERPQADIADIYVGTFGKAIGTSGAFVAGSSELIDYLTNFARSYIYTTAMPPILAYVTDAVFRYPLANDSRSSKLFKNIRQLADGLQQQGWAVGIDNEPCQTAIIPVIIGDNEKATLLAEKLKSAGFWVSAIRPPTVPVGTARLRFCVSSSHTDEQIARLLKVMQTLKYDHIQ